MKTRSLGATGLRIGEVGFGAWGIGGGMWRGGDDGESCRALAVALERGVDLVDTALAYGEGHSERLVAKVLDETGSRERVVVSTKIPPMGGGWPGRAESTLREVFPGKHITACVERSLRNLRAESLHIQQLHVWHDAWLDGNDWDETLATMIRLQEGGKVLHWGLSVNDHAPETALKALGLPVFETAQVIYNIYDRSPERDLFPLAARKPLGIIVRVPFDEGALTGTIGPDTVFPKGDWREGYFRGDRRAEVAGRAERLATLLGEEARSLPELALRFCLSRPEVSAVIPGMRRVRHVVSNVAVADGRRLSTDILERLEKHAWPKNWYRP